MKVSDRYDTYLRRYERVNPKNVIFRENLTFDPTLLGQILNWEQKQYVQSRDLVEAHRLFFFREALRPSGADRQGWGVVPTPPPLTVPVRNALIGRGLTLGHRKETRHTASA